VTSPSNASQYVVQAGDTLGEIANQFNPGDYLSAIAQRYNTTVGALLDANLNITNPDLMLIDAELWRRCARSWTRCTRQGKLRCDWRIRRWSPQRTRSKGWGKAF
jgi:LysM domain